MKKIKALYQRCKLLMIERKMSLPLIIVVETFLFGLFIIFHPAFLETRGAYEYVLSILDDEFVGVLFIVLSIIYFLSTIFSAYKIKRISGIFVFSLWGFFFLSFLVREFYGYPTTGWILTLGMLLIMNFELRTGEYK